MKKTLSILFVLLIVALIMAGCKGDDSKTVIIINTAPDVTATFGAEVWEAQLELIRVEATATADALEFEREKLEYKKLNP